MTRYVGICTGCDGKLEMYYEPWCPRCDKPEPEIIESLNLIKVFRHLIAIGEITEEQKGDFWTYLVNHNYIKGNDMSFDANFRWWLDDTETWSNDSSEFIVAKAITKHFGEKTYTWEVSW